MAQLTQANQMLELGLINSQDYEAVEKKASDCSHSAGRHSSWSHWVLQPRSEITTAQTSAQESVQLSGQ